MVRICREAIEYGFASVCVNPYYVPLVADLVRGSRVLTCTVVGFPLGANMPETKAAETARAVADGAGGPVVRSGGGVPLGGVEEGMVALYCHRLPQGVDLSAQSGGCK